MILVITGIGSLIHIYSTAYMHDERDSEFARYFSYLNLFAAFMLVLVLGSNFLVMFVGWEGVGLCSYLLIGFWLPEEVGRRRRQEGVHRQSDRRLRIHSRRAADLRAVRHHRVPGGGAPGGDAAARGRRSDRSRSSRCCCSSARPASRRRFRCYVWLPDAMEGPTPVSALIHAATMVTAGVYMIGRNAVLFSHAPETLGIIAAIVGAATAFFAGTIGLVQTDIKRVLAYSTVSQLGYMFLAMGVGAYTAGIFHLFTHAFFKALLFLGSGAVIHALHGEQDLRHMGGLKKELPITYWTFVIGALAIAGVPGLRRLLQQGRDPVPHLRQRPHHAVDRRAGDVAADGGLHVPAGVSGVSRRAARRAGVRAGTAMHASHGGRPRPRRRSPARCAAGHGAGAGRAGDRLGRWPAMSACRTPSAERIGSRRTWRPASP